MNIKIKGMTLVEVVVAMGILLTLLVGLIPMFIGVMKATTRDRWETLATARAKELIEIIKRVAATPAGYLDGDTNNDGSTSVADERAYRELLLTDGNHSDRNNPIYLGTGTQGVRANRMYSVVTTGVGASSFKTVTVWINPLNNMLLSSVTVQTMITAP